METIYIYGLYVENENIRYVGKTNNLKKRLYEHVNNSKNKKTHKDNWIQKELKLGNEIKIKILEKVTLNNWQEKEQYWIQHYNLNHLTNHAKGGLGGRGKIYTMNYNETKNWVINNLKCDSKNKWRKLVKNSEIPNFIPRNPREVYLNNGWVSWGDFLSTNRIQDNLIAIDYLSYEKAKEIIKKLKIKTEKEWKITVKKKLIPNQIPNRPERYYKNRGWVSWGDFLGTNRIANQNKKFIAYGRVKEWLIDNNYKFKSRKDWLKFCKDYRPKFIPSNPDKTYKDNGWVNWGEFFK